MSDKPKMDAETAEALEKSIAHWKENARAETPGQASTNGEDCALCHRFNDAPDEENDCDGCPVKEATGKQYCEMSPWREASRARMRWGRADPAQHDAFRTAALAEVAFLESLRDTP